MNRKLSMRELHALHASEEVVICKAGCTGHMRVGSWSLGWSHVTVTVKWTKLVLGCERAHRGELLSEVIHDTTLGEARIDPPVYLVEDPESALLAEIKQLRLELAEVKRLLKDQRLAEMVAEAVAVTEAEAKVADEAKAADEAASPTKEQT